MKFLSVLLSICLCVTLSVSAMQMPEGGNFQFNGERPKGGPQGDGQQPSGTPQQPTATREPAAEGNDPAGDNTSQFPGRGEGGFQPPEGGFQPPEGGGFPGFGGGNPWGQNPEDMAGQEGLMGIWVKYSNIIISLGVLIVAFVFVGLYRRRHY